MKKCSLWFLVVIVFLLISFSRTDAQVYHAFPDSNARWSQESTDSAVVNSAGEIVHFYKGALYTLGNDTVINSKKYRLVGYQESWIYLTDSGNGFNNIIFDEQNYSLDSPKWIFGAIREDSTRKIWFYNFVTGVPACSYVWTPAGFWPVDSELLLYDFNLHIGDTVNYIPESFSPWVYVRTVIAIDSVQLNDGLYRKRYLFQQGSNPDDYWIEGIGSSLGLFGAYNSPPGNGSSYCWLNCFWQDGNYLFEKPSITLGITCDSLNISVLNSVATINSNSNKNVEVLPNPFNTVAALKFTLSHPSAISLSVFNANGQLFKTLLNNEILSAGTHSVNFYGENNPNGLYYYMLRSSEEMITGKLILER